MFDNRLSDPEWYLGDSYHEGFRQLREHEPVRFVDDQRVGRPYWAVTTYDDVKACVEDEQLFSSRWGSPRLPRSGRRWTPEERHALALDVRVNHLDPPTHGVYRRPMNKHFSVPAVKKWQEPIERLVAEVLAEIDGRGEFDFISDVAGELPMRLISYMLGVPESDRPRIQRAAAMFALAADPRYMIDNDPVATAARGLEMVMEYTLELAEARRREPRDDFATMISQLHIDGDQLSIHEVRGWLFALLLGGFETTRNALGVGVWQLTRHTDQLELFMQDESSRAPAIEEILRWCTPARTLLRTATEDCDLGGNRVRAGDWVVLFLASANWDEKMFVDPEKFDIRREPHPHFGFGGGIHNCLGRHLVRLEMGIALPLILERLAGMEVPENPPWILDNSSSGLAELRVKVPAARVDA